MATQSEHAGIEITGQTEIETEEMDLVPSRRNRVNEDGEVFEVRSPKTLEEAKSLHSAGVDVELGELSDEDRRAYVAWLQDFKDRPETAPRRGNEKLEFVEREATLTAIHGRNATDSKVSTVLDLSVGFVEEELGELPDCIRYPAEVLLSQAAMVDEGSNSAEVAVKRDWRTLAYRFKSPAIDEIVLIANIKGAPKFKVVSTKSATRLTLNIKLSADVPAKWFAQLAAVLQKNDVTLEAFEHQPELGE